MPEMTKKRTPKTVCLVRVDDRGNIVCATSPMTRPEAEELQARTGFSTQIVSRVKALRGERRYRTSLRRR